MKRKIFLSVFFLLFFMILISSSTIMVILYGNFINQSKVELRSFSDAISIPSGLHGTDFLSEMVSNDYRITLIAPTGEVLYDNRADISEMENHLNREEVMEAFEGGIGESDRYSDTLMERTFYHSRLLSDGNVLRISKSYSSMPAFLLKALPPMGLFLFIACVLSLVAARLLSSAIANPINKMDLMSTSHIASPYRELTPLIDRISAQQDQIKEQMQNLKRKQDEFHAITENMSEGFIVIGKQGEVVSYNSSALALFAIKHEDSGVVSIYDFDNSPAFQNAVARSLNGYHTELTMPRGQRYYNVIANPIEDSAGIVGSVIIALDVTEKEEREKLRREFTANVSHELKTPLTSISVTAEVMRSGLIGSDDIKHFAGNIYSEAKRLIALVNDIIKLSRLDEGGPDGNLAKDDVSLVKIINTVVDRLSVAAETKHLKISVQTDESTVYGCAPILEDMIYNLYDNAIKYNKDGGAVKLTLTHREDDVVFSVKDTGIGIPHDEIPRIFERFYRVDKSHSNEIGGTGLGLSIVKHAAMMHNAEIRVKSELDCGTEISILFKK